MKKKEEADEAEALKDKDAEGPKKGHKLRRKRDDAGSDAGGNAAGDAGSDGGGDATGDAGSDAGGNAAGDAAGDDAGMQYIATLFNLQLLKTF